ncbi:MAG: 50S ribosomal protein L6 [Patescibacteria group bacterium]|nr:50S ribosomal protein L6 [Patescibacteria group bacterium]
MSKIGNKPIEINKEVSIDINNRFINIKGPLGSLSYSLPEILNIEKKDNFIFLKRLNEDKKSKSLHGLYRQLIANAVIGVYKKWEKQLKIVGTGYNAKVDNGNLVLKLGYSHPIIFKKVEGIDYQVKDNTIIIVSGCDKQKVGEVAYQIKILKKPDVYKGKGIQYVGEKLRIKPGKKAKTAGTA